MVYAPSQSSALKHEPGKFFSNGAFSLERAACGVFGFSTFGVHLTGPPEISFGPAETDDVQHMKAKGPK